jgi:hypothetical protein
MRGWQSIKPNIRRVGPNRWRWNVLAFDQTIASGVAPALKVAESEARAAQRAYLERNESKHTHSRGRHRETYCKR